MAEAYGLRTLVHSCSWDLNLASINESIRQASVGQVIASLQLAKAIGAEEVTVHPGHLTLAGITDRSCQILHHSLEEISEAAASMSLAVSLEIMEKIKKEFVTTAAAMQAVTGELFPKFSYTVDIAHCDSLSEARQLLTFMPGVSKIHISNRRGAVYHTPLGEGDYDLSAFWPWLQKRNLPAVVIEGYDDSRECTIYKKNLAFLHSKEDSFDEKLEKESHSSGNDGCYHDGAGRLFRNRLGNE